MASSSRVFERTLAASLLFSAICCRFAAATQPVIAAFGDSWAALNQNYGPLDTYCVGRDYENFGVGGSTAQEWANQVGDCNASARLEHLQANGVEVSHVWLQIGGNDALKEMNVDSVVSNIETVIQEIRKFYPNAAVVMLGYAVVGLGRLATDSEAVALFEQLNAAVREGANAMDGTFMDTWELLGADPENTQLGDEKYYVDAIHPNTVGYCNIWTQDAMQKVLGCESPTTPYDCGDSALLSDYVPCLCYSGNGCENDCSDGYECKLVNSKYNPVCVESTALMTTTLGGVIATTTSGAPDAISSSFPVANTYSSTSQSLSGAPALVISFLFARAMGHIGRII